MNGFSKEKKKKRKRKKRGGEGGGVVKDELQGISIVVEINSTNMQITVNNFIYYLGTDVFASQE